MRLFEVLLIMQMGICQYSFGQLSILNPSFSQADTCPVYIDEFELLTHWQSVTGASDFYDCNFTFLIDHPISDYNPGYGKYVGFDIKNDVLLTADSFGQNLNEPILPGQSITIGFNAQTVYGGAYKNDCAGISVYGIKDTISSLTAHNNASEYPTALVLGTTPIMTNWWWEFQSITFTASDTINALIFSPEIIASCKQYFFLDEISIMQNSLTINETSNHAIQMFPNPCRNIMFMSSSLDLKGNMFSVYSVAGHLIQNGVLEHNYLNTKEFESGTYFINIKTDEKTVTTRFIKE